jgi:ABC-type Fe3+-hydroxamate transport system substrate-binding protein
MLKYTDQMGQVLELASTPKRIVSIVPSQTELLAHWGQEDKIVGITKFCIHPESCFKNKTKVGGTKKLNMSVIEALQPDLIIGNMEENEQEDIEYLKSKFPVWMSNIKNLVDCYKMMSALGELLDCRAESEKMIRTMKHEFSLLSAYLPDAGKKKVAYFIWQEPLMVAAGDTFIHEMLKIAGYCNVFSGHQRYPQIQPSELQAAEPDLIFLSSEPYPFGEKHIAYFNHLCPDVRTVVVDGELFSWYGSRLLAAPEYFKNLHALLA